jgi:hypothetical protein
MVHPLALRQTERVYSALRRNPQPLDAVLLPLMLMARIAALLNAVVGHDDAQFDAVPNMSDAGPLASAVVPLHARRQQASSGRVLQQVHIKELDVLRTREKGRPPR